MIPTKPTKAGSIDSATGTDIKSYIKRQSQKKQDAKKEALKSLEDVASSKEKEQLTTVLEGIINMIIEQEAKDGDIFGKYLFGQQRKTEPAKSEKNTAEEEDFLAALEFWVVDHWSRSLEDWFPEVWSLVQKGKYVSLLKPDDRPVYRLIHGHFAAKAYGLTKNETFMKKVSALEAGEDVDAVLDGKPFLVQVDKAFPKIGNLQSWSFEPQNLINFLKPGQIAILLKTTPTAANGKFLLNPYNLVSELSYEGRLETMLSYLETETEVVSFGDVKVEAAVAAFVPVKNKSVASFRRIINDMKEMLEGKQ